MEPRQTALHYDRLAAHWAGEAFNRQNGIEQHAKALRFAPPSGRALDVGCGSSGRIIALLISHGFAVEGLDISTGMLELEKQKHPEVMFHHADICSWEAPQPYDFISAWDSIWHVPLGKHRDVLATLCAALAPEGILIFTSGGIDAPEEGSNPFLGQELYHAALGIPTLLKLVEEFGCVCRHLEYDQFPPEKHLYLIVQKRGGGGNR